jgi:hypothetical protein
MIQSHCRPDLLLAPGRTTRDRMRIIDSLRLKDIPSAVREATLNLFWNVERALVLTQLILKGALTKVEGRAPRILVKTPLNLGGLPVKLRNRLSVASLTAEGIGDAGLD